jgi:hypothetical protein
MGKETIVFDRWRLKKHLSWAKLGQDVKRNTVAQPKIQLSNLQHSVNPIKQATTLSITQSSLFTTSGLVMEFGALLFCFVFARDLK